MKENVLFQQQLYRCRCSVWDIAGVVTPLGRKREIYSICHEYGITIIEDDAYYYLQYPELQGGTIQLDLQQGLDNDVDTCLCNYTAPSILCCELLCIKKVHDGKGLNIGMTTVSQTLHTSTQTIIR